MRATWSKRSTKCSCGTALNERHIRLLKRFADTVFLVLDGDAAGQSRTNDILELFVAAQMDLRILTLPDELDPAEFMLEHGLVMYDAFYAWCRACQGETHNWTPAAKH